MRCQKKEPKILVRMARKSDREDVFAFCARTWYWGDYISDVWDDWLKQKNGRVFVATLDGKPVGITHLEIDGSDGAWLSGARTDRNYRRLGVATTANLRAMKYAKEKGATVARLCTRGDNRRAQAVLEKLGFRPRTTFSIQVLKKPLAGESRNARWATEADSKSSWNLLCSSKMYHASAGMYTVADHYHVLTEEVFLEFVRRHRAILHEDEEGQVDGTMLVDDAIGAERGENSIQTCYVDGTAEAVCEMAAFLRSHCRALGIDKIYAFAPLCEHVIAAFEKQGFKPPGSTEIVYEKML